MSITPQTRILKRDGLFQGHRRNLKISWLLRNQFESKFTSEEALGTFERPIKLYDYQKPIEKLDFFCLKTRQKVSFLTIQSQYPCVQIQAPTRVIVAHTEQYCNIQLGQCRKQVVLTAQSTIKRKRKKVPIVRYRQLMVVSLKRIMLPKITTHLKPL